MSQEASSAGSTDGKEQTTLHDSSETSSKATRLPSGTGKVNQKTSTNTRPRTTTSVANTVETSKVHVTDYPEDQFNGMFKQGIPDKLVVMTFDDALQNHYTKVAPELKKRHFGGTFYACELNFAYYGAQNYADGVNKGIFMTWEEMKELSDEGFEIGNHYLTHTSGKAETMAKLQQEIGGLESRCADKQIPKPVTAAYPGLLYTTNSINYLKKNGYTFARTGISAVYDPTQQHPMKVMGIDGSFELNTFISLVSKAKNGKIVVLIYHDVPDRASFVKTLDYLQENQYTVISMRQLGDYIDSEKAVAYFEED